MVMGSRTTVSEKADATPPSSPSIEKDGGAAPAPFAPGWRFYVCFSTLSIITLAAALDATSLSVALPIISQKLHGSAIEAFWSGTSFLIASTVLQPSYASFSHIFGRKALVMAALALFTLGAILAAVAHDFTLMLVGRSIQGIGGGGVIVLTEVIITDLVPLRERGKWFGFVSMMWAIGSVTGPIVGGTFAEKVSWRWIFWLNLPFCGMGFALIPFVLRLHSSGGSFAAKLRRVDYVGTVLFVGATMAVLIPITWGGVMYPWSHWRTVVPLVIGAVGLVAFGLYERWVPAEPLIRLSIFGNRTAVVTYVGTFIHGMILWSLVYYIPLYYEAVKNSTPIMAGVSVMPETLTVAPVSVVCGVVVSITGRYRWAIWSGWLLTTVGMGLLCLLDVPTKTVEWVLLNLIAGVGTGLLFPAMAFAIQASATDHDMAFAVAMFSFFRAFGQSVGVAIGGVIFQSELRKQLLKFPELVAHAADLSKDASGLVEVIKTMPHDLPAHIHLVSSYAAALRIVWAVMCAFGGLALVASLFTRGLSLDRALVTEQGFQHDAKARDVEG
ncbi:MAG: hypothetical protein M1826_002791 [Phylliscum demangeonii]|nr:MAG: hypothetical protein M1826_002791 [Phylliscum demangeonii]